MTGAEIVTVGKAAQAVAKKALGEDQKTKDILLRVAEGTPEMKSAARTMAARTAVKERVKLKLWEPFARMVGVSEDYFRDTFPLEMGAKIANIPDENLITPPASVAVPALLGLSYTFEEPSLKEMYLNLLATACDEQRAGQAHPAFAEIIKQLAPEEARVLNATLGRTVAVARAKDVVGPDGAYVWLMTHLMPLLDGVTREPIEEPQVPTWVDNWQRLGLVTVTYAERATGEHAYDWVESRPEYVRMAENPAVNKLGFEMGVMRTTDFGQRFFCAVTD